MTKKRNGEEKGKQIQSKKKERKKKRKKDPTQLFSCDFANFFLT